MNKVVKWHKPCGPAFKPGEIWVGASGNKVEIISVRKYTDNDMETHSSDYGVKYKTDPLNNPEKTHEKDGWNFQVRYTHQSDLHVQGTK